MVPDSATYLSDVTLPDGTTVYPGQTVTKTWRMRNTGKTTWGSGYQLAFRSGNRLGAPETVSVPALTPNQEGNISVTFTIPGDIGPGSYTARWRLRNPSGTYFGDEIWFKLQVPGSQPSGGNGVDVALDNLNFTAQVSPGQQFWPAIRMRVTSGQLKQSRGDMLRFYGGTNYSDFPQVGVVGTVDSGQTYTFNFYSDHPMVAPTSEGTYESRWRVWANGGWVGPEIVMRFTVYQPASSRPPNKPSLTSPNDWAVLVGQMPTLCAQHNGDPDGDSIAAYRFVIFDSAQNWDSGWGGNNCVAPSGLGNYGYQWHAQVRDSRGAVSDWSDTRHFNLESSTVTINEFYFQPPSPSNADTVVIRAGTTGCGGTNIYLRALVNTATDGSANGEWRQIKELGVPRFNDADAPRWDTLEYAEGVHRIRIEATSCDGTKVVAEQNYTLLRGKPSRPYLLAPANGFWSNSRAITFRWQAAMRANNYTLIVGPNPDPEQSPLLNITLSGTEYTHTFDQDYPRLYWRVYANNENGRVDQSGWWVGIDRTAPSSSISSSRTPAVAYENQFTVALDGSDGDSGVFTYDVQYRVGTDTTWQDWLLNYPYATAIFTGRPGSTYCFRSRAHDVAGNTEEYPTAADTCTQVDPTRRPPQTWWNTAYQFKRNLVVVNRMGDIVLPADYPVLLRFDSSTTPTAAEIYAASTASTKGYDIRIAYNDATEVRRYLTSFTSSLVEIWFVAQADIPVGNSSTAYSLYYGNTAAGDPGYRPRDVFVPRGDGNTRLLFYFDEGSGTTAYDASDYGNNGALIGSFSQPWPAGRFRTGLSFNGSSRVNVNHSSSVSISGPITLEAWVRPTLIDNNTRNIISKLSPSGGSSYRLYTVSGYPRMTVLSDPAEGTVQGDTRLAANQWYHLAGTYDGSTVRLFVNGVEVKSKAYSTGVRLSTAPVVIGSTGYQEEYFVGDIDQASISAVARPSFPQGRVNVDPSAAAGQQVGQESIGPADLVLQSLTTYPNPEGGILVQASLKNQGLYPTYNEFFVHLYGDHTPTGPGDLTNSVGFWVNAPIQPGTSLTMTTVLSQLTLGALTAHKGAASDAPLAEQTISLAGQVDSTGSVNEPDNANNILTGPNICFTNPDRFEGDDTIGGARPIALDETQTHNAHRPGDLDWLKFNAQAGVTYTVATSRLGIAADTYLYLYDANGTTLLASNDDFNGSLASQLEWTAPATGTYYLLIQQWNPNVGGCGTAYDISLHRVLPPIKPAIFRQGTWFLRNSFTPGPADQYINYGVPSDIPLLCDWDGNGTRTLGVYRPSTAAFYLRNSNTPGSSEVAITYGLPSDVPVCGDWDGDGVETVGVFRPSNAALYLRNSNTNGPADLVFLYGIPGDIFVSGDWNGDKVDTVGIRRGNVWFLKNSNTDGPADLWFDYGLPTDLPLTGDWDNDGDDTPGVYRDGMWYLRNSNMNGAADFSLNYGAPGDIPLVWR